VVHDFSFGWDGFVALLSEGTGFGGERGFSLLKNPSKKPRGSAKMAHTNIRTCRFSSKNPSTDPKDASNSPAKITMTAIQTIRVMRLPRESV